MSHPVRFTPAVLEKVWGGRKLAERLGRSIPDGSIGESWDVSAREEAPSVAIGGEHDGRRPDEILGAPFPLLVKLLDATKTLSVQVHPGADICNQWPGAEPKHEAWIVLDADPGALIYRGFRDGIDRAAFERAIDSGTVGETIHTFEPQPGDVIEIPTGTIHAIGSGCLLLEVQQPSDTTFRVDDWGRVGLDGKPRELHIEASLRSLDFSPRTPDRIEGRLGPQERLVEGESLRIERVQASSGGSFSLEADRVTVVSNLSETDVRLDGDVRPRRFGDSAVYCPGSHEGRVADGGKAVLILTSGEIDR